MVLEAIIVSIVAFFPPWTLVYRYDELRIERFAGYHPIWSSNAPTDSAALSRLLSRRVRCRPGPRHDEDRYNEARRSACRSNASYCSYLFVISGRIQAAAEAERRPTRQPESLNGTISKRDTAKVDVSLRSWLAL